MTRREVGLLLVLLIVARIGNDSLLIVAACLGAAFYLGTLHTRPAVRPVRPIPPQERP